MKQRLPLHRGAFVFVSVQKYLFEAILSLQAYSGMLFIKRWIEILCAFGCKAEFLKNYALKVRTFVLQLLV